MGQVLNYYLIIKIVTNNNQECSYHLFIRMAFYDRVLKIIIHDNFALSNSLAYFHAKLFCIFFKVCTLYRRSNYLEHD